jgi:hypothetical protein
LTKSINLSEPIIFIMSAHPNGNPQGNPVTSQNGNQNGSSSAKPNPNPVPVSNPALMPNGKPYIPAPPARIHTKEDAEFLQSLHRRAQAIREA